MESQSRSRWPWIAGGIGLLVVLLMTKRGKQVAQKAADVAQEGAAAVSDFFRKLLDRSEKAIVTLEPSFQPTVRQFLADAHAAGYNVVITSGRRTMAEQRALYAQGRTAAGKIVTNAQAGDSPHNFGLSFDFAFANALGQPTWPDNGPWAEVAAIGKKLGMEWGGDWKSFKDRPHLESPSWRVARTEWKAGNLAVA